MEQVQNQLEAVTAEITKAQERHNDLSAQWRHQCESGVLGAAEATEAEIDALERNIDRLLVRQNALQQQINEAHHAQQVARAEQLTREANSAVRQVESTLSELAPLANTIALHVTGLTSQAEACREAIIRVRQTGGRVEGFSSQAQTAQVSALVESLGVSKQRIAGIAQGLSRFSVGI